MPAFPCLGHYDDILTQFFPIYQIVFTNLSIPICHLPIWLYQIVITKMSLPNCHLPIWLYQFVFTNLSLPNCLYQIVIYQIVNYQIIFTKNPPVMTGGFLVTYNLVIYNLVINNLVKTIW